jgi:hypothetical protein
MHIVLYLVGQRELFFNYSNLILKDSTHNLFDKVAESRNVTEL